ncbi:MAG: hypothetical protein K2N06_06010 [Oscillospiraceae bacterium]|nr:hypothetical protein [Oscillospiraceae bacterium]
MENKFTPELIEKARQAKSAEELLALAKENEIELTELEAKAYFEQLNKSGELSDDELGNVAGGGCYRDDGRLVVTEQYSCKRFRCAYCGQEITKGHHKCAGADGFKIFKRCVDCKYSDLNGVLFTLVCNHPDNYKR